MEKVSGTGIAIKLHLPSACPVKDVLHRVTELLYLVRPPALS
ncbi:hypothetical protein RM530_00370 [Algiphilus sp. W345]|uniref:Uncharacterized protein n=1 Tax=Banduia mediterranea TaxID=3075609 RepID=A0ABU2WE76_9GAMM|nr:hypothetical protein [Algiphilus sp. W345]MDT0495823.1 hypothetical protein [Algiphilus sp. W345]